MMGLKGIQDMPRIEIFTKPQLIHASFQHKGHKYEVIISTPDLSHNPYSCWGDWGPMYTFSLREGQGIALTYRCPARRIASAFIANPKYLHLNSPMHCEEREKWPLCLDFEDEERGARFLAFLNSWGEVERTEVEASRSRNFVGQAVFAHHVSTEMSA